MTNPTPPHHDVVYVDFMAHSTPPWCGFHDTQQHTLPREHNIPGIHGLDH